MRLCNFGAHDELTRIKPVHKVGIMPYYVYKMNEGVSSMIRNLEYLDEFETFKEAKNLARTKRSEQDPQDKAIFKVIFAANQLAAEEMLTEKREEPILREWEK